MKKLLLFTFLATASISFAQTTGGIPTSPLALGTVHDFSGVANNTDMPTADWYSNNGVNNLKVNTETGRIQYKAYAADGSDHAQLGRDKLAGIQANVAANTDYTLTVDLEWCGMRVLEGSYDGTTLTSGTELASFAFANTNTTRETRTVNFNSGANTTILIEFYLPANEVSANTTGTVGVNVVYDFAWFDNVSLAEGTLGLEDAKISKALNIFPNPVKDVLNFSDKDVKTATVYSLLGQKVLENTITNQLNVASLTKGIYLMQIKNESGVISKKFIKN